MSSPEAWVSLLVLSLMEVVLGIDNIVFITILCGRLPRERQLSARRLGLGVALVARLAQMLNMRMDRTRGPAPAASPGGDA